MKNIKSKLCIFLFLMAAACFTSCKSVKIKGGCDCPSWSENQFNSQLIIHEQKV